jgi:transcriptional regulator with XRE-family HTH domain
VDVEERAARRYAALVWQLADEMGQKYGWRSRVARKLGVSQPYISQIANGDRTGIGIKAIESAIKKLPLERDYFYGEHAGTPHYSGFVPSRVATAAAYPALDEFLATAEGKAITEDELEFLRSYRASHGEPTTVTYHYALMGFRSELAPEEAAESAEVTERALASARRRGGQMIDEGES